MSSGQTVTRSPSGRKPSREPAEPADTTEARPATAAAMTAVPAMPGLAGLALGDGGNPSGLRRSSPPDHDPLGGAAIPGDVLSTLRQRRGGGRPLPSGPASQIGAELGPVASAARIHTDAESDRLARSVQAVAFSYGSDVYFSRGSYSPDTESGQHLLAHELSHVAQGASSGSGAIVGRADDPAEHEADRSADRVLGALRRQAARLTPPAGNAAGPEKADRAAEVAPGPLALRAAPPAGEAIHRVYALGDRPALLALPQIGGSDALLNALEPHNWTRAETVALSQSAPAPSYAEMNAIMGAFSAAQVQAIIPICAGWAQLAALASLGWAAADITRLAGMAPPPTFAQLQATAAFFSSAEAANALLICAGWADLVTLTGLGWPAADVARFAAPPARPALAQLQATAAFFTPAQTDAVLPICAGWPDVLTLTGLGWPAADVARFAALAARPTLAQLQATAAFFTPAQTDTVLPSCAGWPDVLVLTGLGWSAADIATFAGLPVRPTVAQLQPIAAFYTAAQAQTVRQVCTGWPDLVTLAGLGWAAADIAFYAGQDPAPTFAQLHQVCTRFTTAQLDDVAGTGGFAWDDIAGLAGAAAPGVQSPAITLQNALNACAQLVADDLHQLSTIGVMVTPDRYKALLIGTNSLADIDGMIVRDYLSDARWFSICFDTARRLLDDLGNAPAYASGGATDAKYALVQQQARSGQLVADLNSAALAPAPVIFDIHVGGHGFTLTVIGNQVHQLEAFASQAGRPGEDPQVLANGDDLRMSLLTSIGANHTYPIATVTTAITRMTSANPAHRATGANTMGWNAGPCGFLAGGLIADPMAIWWQASSLHSNGQIVVNIAERIHRQRAQIREKLGLPAV